MYYKSHSSDLANDNFFTIKVENLIREIIIQHEIPYYRIESGVETKAGEVNVFRPLIRIITYFEDTVNEMSHIIHDEFDVAMEQPGNKKKISTETFAYKNIYYALRLKDDRQKQIEYKRYSNKIFELQICSMLQDAWEGIEKEIGYDNTTVHHEQKRDIYRVGALLEMADIEFTKIRTEASRRKLNSNQASIQHTIPATTELPDITNTHINPNTIAELPATAELPKLPETEIKTEAPAAQPLLIADIATAPEPQEEVASRFSSLSEFEEEVFSQQATQPCLEMCYPVGAHVPVKALITDPVTYPIVPRPAMPLSPVAGTVKATAMSASKLPENVIAERNNVDIDRLKLLAQSINKAGQKNNITIGVPQPAAIKEEPKPVMATPPPAIEAMAAANPAAEIIPPVAEKSISKPQKLNTPPAISTGDLQMSRFRIAGIEEDMIFKPAADRTIPIYNESIILTNRTNLDGNEPITNMRLRDYVSNCRLVEEIDHKIAERIGAKINAEINIDGDIERLSFLKVFTLKQLHGKLLENKNNIIIFAEKWIGKYNCDTFDAGICLLYLEYLLVGKRNDPAFAVEFVLKFISDDDYNARYIIPTYNSIFETKVLDFSQMTLVA